MEPQVDTRDYEREREILFDDAINKVDPQIQKPSI